MPNEYNSFEKERESLYKSIMRVYSGPIVRVTIKRDEKQAKAVEDFLTEIDKFEEESRKRSMMICGNGLVSSLN